MWYLEPYDRLAVVRRAEPGVAVRGAPQHHRRSQGTRAQRPRFSDVVCAAATVAVIVATAVAIHDSIGLHSDIHLGARLGREGPAQWEEEPKVEAEALEERRYVAGRGRGEGGGRRQQQALDLRLSRARHAARRAQFYTPAARKPRNRSEPSETSKRVRGDDARTLCDTLERMPTKQRRT